LLLKGFREYEETPIPMIDTKPRILNTSLGNLIPSPHPPQHSNGIMMRKKDIAA
jgi:hypothetical protein